MVGASGETAGTGARTGEVTGEGVRPAPIEQRHENVGPFPVLARGRTGVRFAAGCACGWRSEPYPTAGMAGSALDQHLEALAE